MSQATIPLEFEHYLQNQIRQGVAPDMNEMVFAYIPHLDISQPLNREVELPDTSLWVYKQDVDQVGKLGENALVYSVVIPSAVAEFKFNAIYLHDKNHANSCGMVVYKAEETKELGMSITKSLMQQYTGAAQVSGISVDAETWQIDFQARLLGIDEDMRLANLDYYGHTAFMTGFDVIKQAETQYQITAGVVYVAGLRAELVSDVVQQVSNKPIYLYLDVSRTGTTISQWQNQVLIRASETPLDDYIDDAKQPHYLAQLVRINSDGSVKDLRTKGGLSQHIEDDNPHPQYADKAKFENKVSTLQFDEYNPNRKYSVGETCWTRKNGDYQVWEWYSNVESLAEKNPLDEANRQVGWDDDTKPFYWTPAKKARAGSPLFPWMSMSFPEGTLNVIGNSVPSAVFWRLAKAHPEFVNETTGMIDYPDTRGEFFRVLDQGRGVDNSREFTSTQEDMLKSHHHRAKHSYDNGQVNSGGGYLASDTTTWSGKWNTDDAIENTGGVETRPRNLAFPILVEI